MFQSQLQIKSSESIVRQSTRYRDLPTRIVSQHCFDIHPICSYGIIAFNPNSSKWLVVKRNHSPQMVAFLRGDYTKSDLPHYFQGMTITEHRDISKALAGELKISDLYYKYFTRDEKASNELKEEGKRHCYDKMYEHENYIRFLLQNVKPKTDQEWLWPKGRPYIHEHKILCAEREFREETGVKTQGRSLDRDPLIERTVASNGKVYETQLWIWIFDIITSVNGGDNSSEAVKDGDEIGDVRWVTFVEALELLQEPKRKILVEAWEKIKKNGILNKF
jgi:8-oxo-dGTP pyrophosphatase MutT (NUDIX family)